MRKVLGLMLLIGCWSILSANEKPAADWDAAALPVVQLGMQDHAAEAATDTDPLMLRNPTGKLGFPWKKRSIGFQLADPTTITNISLTLYKMTDSDPAEQSDFSNVRILVSEDNKSFTLVKPEKITHRTWRENNRLYDQVAVLGKFPGKYFRIYVPYTARWHVFGSDNLSASLRVFGESALMISAVDMPLVCEKTLAMNIKVHRDDDTRGTLSVTMDDKTLLNRNLSEIPAGKSFQTALDLTGFTPGVHKVTITAGDSDKEFSRTATQFVRVAAGDLPLSPIPGENWRKRTQLIGGQAMDILVAEKNAKPIQYTVPQDGIYTLYATVIGKKSQFQVVLKKGLVRFQLESWHPADLTDFTVGEVPVAIAEFKAGEKFELGSRVPDSQLGELRLAPATAEDLRLWNNAPEYKPTVILHDDGYSGFFSGVTPEQLTARVAAVAKAHAFGYEWCVGTNAVNYPSKVSNPFWEGVENFPRQGDKLAAETIRAWHERGDDPVKLVIETARKNNLRSIISLRANACYGTTPGMNSLFYQKNPQFRVKTGIGWGLSYAYSEVRDFYLGIIKEIAAYRPDAIALDFLRHPPFFGYDQPLIAEYAKRYGQCRESDFGNENWQLLQCELMSDFVRKARQAIDAVDPKIALEVSFDEKNYYAQGLDVAHWLKSGWVDMIAPGIGDVGEEKYFPLQPFTAMIKTSPRKCLLFPRVEATIYGGDTTAKEEQGLEKIHRRNVSLNMFRELFLKFRAEGADGIRPFNTGYPTLAEALADENGLKCFARNIAPLLDVRQELKTER